MFKSTLTIGNVFQRLKSIPDRAAVKFRESIGAEVSGDLQMRVREIMAEEPGEPSSPFEFGSATSLRFWFWLITHNPTLSDGEHWLRTGDLEAGWQTDVSYAGFSTTITVFNTRPSANVIYGPKAVPGHERTGWPKNYERARALVLKEAKLAAFDTFGKAVYDAAREAGFE